MLVAIHCDSDSKYLFRHYFFPSSKSNTEKKATLSRGAELMRLGSKNAELRRHSSEESGNLTGAGSSVQAKPISDFLAEKEALRAQYENEVKGLETVKEEILFTKLMELQWKLLHQVFKFSSTRNGNS